MPTVTEQRTQWADGQVVHGTDLATDENALWAEIAAIGSILIGSNSGVSSTIALTAGAGLTLLVGNGDIYSNGARGRYDGGGTLAIAANSSGNPRWDVVYATLVATAGSNPSGLPNSGNTVSIAMAQGTPSASPVKPTLAAGQVQIGSILVPNGAASAAACTIYQGDYAPNSVGPVYGIINSALTHIAASIASGVVHGLQATTPGGTQGNSLAQTGSTGRVGVAAVADTANMLNNLANDNNNNPSTIPVRQAGSGNPISGRGGTPYVNTDVSGWAQNAASATSAGSATSATTATTATNATQLGGQVPAHYATASGNDGIADTAKVLQLGALIPVIEAGIGNIVQGGAGATPTAPSTTASLKVVVGSAAVTHNAGAYDTLTFATGLTSVWWWNLTAASSPQHLNGLAALVTGGDGKINIQQGVDNAQNASWTWEWLAIGS